MEGEKSCFLGQDAVVTVVVAADAAVVVVHLHFHRCRRCCCSLLAWSRKPRGPLQRERESVLMIRQPAPDERMNDVCALPDIKAPPSLPPPSFLAFISNKHMREGHEWLCLLYFFQRCVVRSNIAPRRVLWFLRARAHWLCVSVLFTVPLGSCEKCTEQE